jgi:hypothetical protein
LPHRRLKILLALVVAVVGLDRESRMSDLTQAIGSTDQRDGGVRRTEDVVGLVIHWPVEPIALRQVRHARLPIQPDDGNDQREQDFQRPTLQSILQHDWRAPRLAIAGACAHSAIRSQR